MALPQAVARAEKLADQLHQEAYGTPEAPKPQVVTPPSEPIAVAPAAPAPKPEDAAPPVDSWESRYKVLTGKYNAEVPRMAAENRTLKETVGSLQAQMGDLTKRFEDAQSRVPVESLIRPEEVTEFGEPLVDMTRRAGKEAVQQAVAPLQSKLDQVQQDVEQIRQSAKEIQWQNFIDLVTQICPEWAQINVNDDFLTWMGGTDDLSGMTRQVLLDLAKRDHDAPRAARFFQTWMATNQDKATAARSAMEQHVVPDSSSRTVVPTGKQFITRAQITAHYANVRAGRISDADAAAIEAEIDAAMQEGRIV